MNIVVLGNGNLYIFENERKGIINTKFYTLGYVEGSSKVGGAFTGWVASLRECCAGGFLKSTLWTFYTLCTFLKVWKPCHVGKDVDLREETICEGDADVLPSLE